MTYKHWEDGERPDMLTDIALYIFDHFEIRKGKCKGMMIYQNRVQT